MKLDSNIALTKSESKRLEIIQYLFDELEKNPRATFNELSIKIGVPLSTLFNQYSKLIKEYQLKGVWEKKS